MINVFNSRKGRLIASARNKSGVKERIIFPCLEPTAVVTANPVITVNGRGRSIISSEGDIILEPFCPVTRIAFILTLIVNRSRILKIL